MLLQIGIALFACQHSEAQKKQIALHHDNASVHEGEYFAH